MFPLLTRTFGRNQRGKAQRAGSETCVGAEAAVRFTDMDALVTKHANAIRGVLSCFDRVLFRGYVPLMSGYAMAESSRCSGGR